MSTSLSTAPPSSTEPSPSRRLPTAVFALGYTVLLIAAIALIALLVRHEATAEGPTPSETSPTPAAGSLPVDRELAVATASPEVIENITSAEQQLGVTLTGTLTQQAVDNPELIGQQIYQLLSTNCVSNLALETPENMQLDVWGFCHASLPADTLTELVARGIEQGTDSVSILNMGGADPKRQVFYTWFAQDPVAENRVLAGWDESYQSHPEIDLVSLSLYGPEEVRVREIHFGGQPQDLTAPTNDELPWR